MSDSEEVTQDNQDNQDKKIDEYATSQVYVSGIPYKVKPEDLKKFFSVCGKVLDIKYPKMEDGSRPKGYAFIRFSTDDEAAEAVDLNGAKLEGRTLNIKYGTKGALTKKPKDGKIVFLSNLNFQTTEKDIREKFSDCGDIVDIRIPTNKKGFKHGICYVEFLDTSSVDKAIKLDGAIIDDRPITVNWALPNRVGKIQKKLQDSTTLFFGNLPLNFTVDKFEDFLKEKGVNSTECRIRLQKRPDGKFKGNLFGILNT